MILDVDLETYNNEQWEDNVFNDKVLACKSTPERDIWKAVHMNDIGEVRRLLKEAPSDIFTFVVSDNR